MSYYVIYDGNCNLCSTLVQWLEQCDRGQQLQYIPMQDQNRLAQFAITAADCEKGMILLDAHQPDRRWQGSDAAEEIGRILPLGATFVALYRSLPGVKWAGDRVYEQVRDHRYDWFGQRDRTYESQYPACPSPQCQGEGSAGCR